MKLLYVFAIFSCFIAGSLANVGLTINQHMNKGATPTTIKLTGDTAETVVIDVVADLASELDNITAWEFVADGAYGFLAGANVVELDGNKLLVVGNLYYNTVNNVPSSDTLTVNARDASGNLIASATFVLALQTVPVVTECMSDTMTIHFPSVANGKYFAIVGFENVPECSFQINTTQTRHVSIPKATCGIEYYSEFEFSVREFENFNVDSDYVSKLTCSKLRLYVDLKDFTVTVSNEEISSNNFFDQGISSTLALHKQGDTTAIINSNAAINDPVTMRIELDPVYTTTFDFIPIECTAGPVGAAFPHIINMGGCSIEPFANFTKTATGLYEANFNLFRTVTDNVPDTNMKFSCVMFVCNLGACPPNPCIM